MTKEVQFIKSKHSCGKKMELRQFSVENSAWVIYGVCKKCNETLILALFLQDRSPIRNIDYIIENKVNDGIMDFDNKHMESYLAREVEKNENSNKSNTN